MKTDSMSQDNAGQILQRVGHCLYRSEQTGRYYAILRRGGKQIKRSLRTTDQALAKRRLSDLEDKASRLNTSENARISFADLAGRWIGTAGTGLKASSQRRLAGLASSLKAIFGPVPVRRITRAQVEQWASERSTRKAARTYNQERATLVRILNYAVREGLILDNPALVVKRAKVPRHSICIPTREQFRLLVETIRAGRADAEAAANLCELLAYSGCRLGEAVSLRWGDINFETRQFTITGGETGTKNHEARTIPLFPALESLLIRLRNDTEQPPQESDRIAGIFNAKKAIEGACRKAGLPHFTHHHLRHFFCSNAIEAGVDFKAIAGWLGHKDGGLLVAKTYGHLRDEHSATMAKRMTFSVKEPA